MTASLLRHEIYRQLQENILSLDLAPGSELREGELAARFRISKSPVRDALMRLESEGLVEIHPRRGYRVRRIAAEDVEDLYGMRLMLERECARRLAEAADVDTVAGLRTAAKMTAADHRDFVGYNRRFHIALATATGRPRLAGVSRRIIAEFDRLIVLSLSRLETLRLQDLEAEHLSIVDAIADGDVARADRLVIDHIGASRGRVDAALAGGALLDHSEGGAK